MNILETSLKDAYVIEPKVFDDERGFFYEGYSEKELCEKMGIEFEVVQINFSKSSYGVLRGLHFQTEPMAQAKLVSVNYGEVWDVAVDLRKNSQTYGMWHGEILSAKNKRRFFVPRGFAHGFIALSDSVDLMYAVDNFYSQKHDNGIRFDDPELNIDWKINVNQIVLSEKDKNLPFLRQKLAEYSK